MNTIIFQTIRAGAVLGVALFAFAGNVFAAPMLTPVTVNNITENSATIVGHVSNPQKNSTVWFELSNGFPTQTAVAVQGIWNEGTFEWNLRDLNPGQTYSYRSVAMESGTTVYSPISSFTTPTPKATSVTISYQSNSSTVSQPVTQTTSTSVTKTVQTKAQTAQTVAVKQATVATAPAKEGFTNGNSAAVIGAGSDLLPSTLIGWVALLIAILLAVLLGHMIYEAPEKRKKAREEEEQRARRESM